MNLRRITPVFLIFAFQVACQPTPAPVPSFYFWRSVFRLSDKEKKGIESLKTNRIYLKYFDVKWDEASQKAIPVAKLIFDDSLTQSIEVVPVVFITNESLQKTVLTDILPLSQHIAQLIAKINNTQNRKLTEIQIDCDWSDLTRDKYFLLLKILKNSILKIKLTCTIRLHQVKYAERTGVPPVDGGVLMFYNMGNLGDRTRNSIYDYETAQRYVRSVRNYPLPLDLALPIFSWAIHYQNKKIKHLISKPNLLFFEDTTAFEKTDKNLYKAKKGQYLSGYYFRENDEIKLEIISAELCQQAAKQVAKHLKKKPQHIIFYDLDQQNLNRFDNEQINQICAYFR
jgi:hypothetical protein